MVRKDVWGNFWCVSNAKSNGMTGDGKKGQMKTIKRKALEKTFSLIDSNRVERPQLWFLGFKSVLPKRMVSLGGGAEDNREEKR